MPRWVFWTLLTLLSWGVWAVLGKRIGDSVTSAQSQVLSTFGMIPLIAALAWQRPAAIVRDNRRGVLLALAAGVISCTGNIPFYYLLNHAPNAAAVVSLTSLAPLVTVLLAVPVLGERLNAVQWIGIALSLAAIYMFSAPGDGGSEPLMSRWLLLALVPIGLWGVTGLLQKMATQYVSGETAALCFLAAFVPMAGLILVAEPLPDVIPRDVWTLTAALGFTLALGNYTVLLAFASGGKASIVSPLSNLYPLVSIPIAILWLGEQVGRREWLAIGVALLAVVTLSYESRPKATEADTPSLDCGQ
jgi:drug/metabolite transporter (DMT)-like permease